VISVRQLPSSKAAQAHEDSDDTTPLCTLSVFYRDEAASAQSLYPLPYLSHTYEFGQQFLVAQEQLA